MARVVKLFKTIRNNWKKSIFGAAAFSYGVSYGIESYETEQIMRQYCEEAVVYGDQPISPHAKPEQITVILNPVANKRKARKLFEKYCEPLLHLAGFAVTIIQTQSENQARNLIANLNTHTDILVVAGGDGTLSDVVTGIMRRYSNNTSAVKQCPIGILPLGQTNKVAESLFHGYENLKEVRELVDATMAIVRGKTKLADVVQVELLEKDPDNPFEPIYAVGTIEWGAWKDARSRMDKYWYWGPLRKYATYVFNGYKSNMSWDCNGVIRYTDPCSGCSKCYENTETSSGTRWWHVFVPKVNNFSADGKKVNYKNITNMNCGTDNEISISTTQLQITTRNVNHTSSIPSVKIELSPRNVSYNDFVSEGWKKLKGAETLVDKTIEARNVEIHPIISENLVDKERILYIDNEEFELKPVKFKLIPDAIRIFCLENK